MIAARGRSGRVAAEHVWWTGDATGPLDRSRVGQWASQMPPEVQHYAALNLGGFLAEHGYGAAVEPRRAVAIVPSGDALAARYDDVLIRLSRSDVAVERPGPASPDELGARDPLVFFGVVGQLDPDRTRPTCRRPARAAHPGPTGVLGPAPDARPPPPARRCGARPRADAAGAHATCRGVGPAEARGDR